MKYTREYMQDLIRIREVIPNLEALKDKTILVTGANGLICSAVVDFLAQLNLEANYRITILCAARNREKTQKRFQDFFSAGVVEYVSYDAMKLFEPGWEVDYVIHGASNANPRYYMEQPVETMLGNLMGVTNLLELLRKQKKGRMLFLSSSEVYGQKTTMDSYREEDYFFVDLLNPRSCYPSSKRAAETLCASYQKEYGTDYVIARPGHVYGSTMLDSDNRISSQFLRDAKQGKDLVMKSEGKQIRSYCYVLDCVSAMITILLNGASGGAYNISNKDSVCSIAQMAEMIADISGVKLKKELPSHIEAAGFNPMDNSSLHSDKLEALGWRGLFNLEQGMRSAFHSI